MQIFGSALYAADRFAICTLLIDLLFEIGQWGTTYEVHRRLRSRSIGLYIDHLLGPRTDLRNIWLVCQIVHLADSLLVSLVVQIGHVGWSFQVVSPVIILAKYECLENWIQSPSLWQWTLHQDHLQVKSRSHAWLSAGKLTVCPGMTGSVLTLDKPLDKPCSKPNQNLI